VFLDGARAEGFGHSCARPLVDRLRPSPAEVTNRRLGVGDAEVGLDAGFIVVVTFENAAVYDGVYGETVGVLGTKDAGDGDDGQGYEECFHDFKFRVRYASRH
jgi:hypothetical protein